MRRARERVLHHSDRGSQYASAPFQELLDAAAKSAVQLAIDVSDSQIRHKKCGVFLKKSS